MPGGRPVGSGSPSRPMRIRSGTWRPGLRRDDNALVNSSMLVGIVVVGALLLGPNAFAQWDEDYEDPQKCAVAAVPGLEMTPSQKIAGYHVPASSAPSGHSAKLFLTVADGSNTKNWEGVLAIRFGIDVEIETSDPLPWQAVAATIEVDGKDVPKLEVRHGGNLYGSGFAKSLRVQTKNNLYSGKAAKVLSRGSTAVLTLYDKKKSVVGRYELPVGPVKDIPKALKASGWRCP